jgi:hypothetical protein
VVELALTAVRRRHLPGSSTCESSEVSLASRTELPITRELRVEAAIAAGCKSMVCSWTPLSGEDRRKQLLALGFESPDGNAPHSDGGFGISFIFGMPLSGLTLFG